jgi:hypothetical protein
VHAHRDALARRQRVARAAAEDVGGTQRAVAPLQGAIAGQRLGEDAIVRRVIRRAEEDNVAFCGSSSVVAKQELRSGEGTAECLGAGGMEAAGKLGSGGNEWTAWETPNECH